MLNLLTDLKYLIDNIIICFTTKRLKNQKQLFNYRFINNKGNVIVILKLGLFYNPKLFKSLNSEISI